MDIGSFPLGPFVISLGGLIVFLGVILAALVLIRTIRDEEISLHFLSTHLFYFVFFPLLFGRIGGFLSDWKAISGELGVTLGEQILSFLKAFLISGAGGVRADWTLGGFFVVFFLIAFLRKEKAFAWLDAFILPGITIAFFLSIGGYISGWSYGVPAPEGLPYPLVVEYNLQYVRYQGPIYAVQLYSATFLAILFAVGWKMWTKKVWQRWSEGHFFAIMMIFIGGGNVVLEFFRGDEVQLVFGEIRLPQVISALIVLGAFLFLFFHRSGSLSERLQKEKEEE